MAAAGLDTWQTEDILVLERTTSIFSVVGCVFIFATFLLSKKFRRPVNRLIFYASWGNLLMNIATLMSVTPFQVSDPKASPLCQFQGFLIQMFLPADAFWNLSMAINVYLTVFHKWSARSLMKLEPFYLVINYGMTFTIALVFLFINEQEGQGRGRMYGAATLWCWLDSEWEAYRIWLCYIPAWVAILAIFVIYTMAWMKIRIQRRCINSKTFDDPPASCAVVDTTPSDIKTTEIRITTELSRHSFVSPIVSPHMPADEPAANTRNNSRKSSLAPSYVFNPFRLDPTCNRGFDPYTVTITRHEDASAIARRNAAAEANAAAWAYTQTALLYFVSLLITWLPSSMNRVYSLVYPHEVSFAFSIMAGLVLPLMGFWNVVIYIVTSWDAVKSLFSDIAHGRAGEFGLPRYKRRTGSEMKGKGWFEIQGANGAGEDAGSEMQRVSSEQSKGEESSGKTLKSQRSRDLASVNTAVVETTWPYRTQQEADMEAEIQGRR